MALGVEGGPVSKGPGLPVPAPQVAGKGSLELQVAGRWQGQGQNPHKRPTALPWGHELPPLCGTHHTLLVSLGHPEQSGST